ncbi:MAG: hypothetical protein JXB49_20255 [Bacteroidales bacterium]|nr:hypothetical protein [Bacteroidales bacterium]
MLLIKGSFQHFENRISKMGYGPGELFNVFDFCYIPKTSQIGILNKLNKIDIFTLSGNYVKTIQIQYFATNLACISSNKFALFVPKIFTSDTTSTCIFFIDQEGKTIETVNYEKIYPEERKSPYIELSNCFFNENDHIIYSEGASSEYIYKIDMHGQKKPIAFYNLKNKLLPYHLKINPEKYRKLKSQYIEPFRFLLTDKHFFLSFEYKGCINNAIYDINDMNVIFKECRKGITNDIDGIYDEIWPISKTRNNKLVFVFYPKDFISPEKLDSIFFNMNEQKPAIDDNPIVLIGQII